MWLNWHYWQNWAKNSQNQLFYFYILRQNMPLPTDIFAILLTLYSAVYKCIEKDEWRRLSWSIGSCMSKQNHKHVNVKKCKNFVFILHYSIGSTSDHVFKRWYPFWIILSYTSPWQLIPFASEHFLNVLISLKHPRKISFLLENTLLSLIKRIYLHCSVFIFK